MGPTPHVESQGSQSVIIDPVLLNCMAISQSILSIECSTKVLSSKLEYPHILSSGCDSQTQICDL